MGVAKNLIFIRKNSGVWLRVLFYLWIFFGGFCQVKGLRPLREKYRSWGDEVSNLQLFVIFVVDFRITSIWCMFCIAVFWSQLSRFDLKFEFLKLCWTAFYFEFFLTYVSESETYM